MSNQITGVLAGIGRIAPYAGDFKKGFMVSAFRTAMVELAKVPSIAEKIPKYSQLPLFQTGGDAFNQAQNKIGVVCAAATDTLLENIIAKISQMKAGVNNCEDKQVKSETEGKTEEKTDVNKSNRMQNVIISGIAAGFGCVAQALEKGSSHSSSNTDAAQQVNAGTAAETNAAHVDTKVESQKGPGSESGHDNNKRAESGSGHDSKVQTEVKVEGEEMEKVGEKEENDKEKAELKEKNEPAGGYIDVSEDVEDIVMIARNHWE